MSIKEEIASWELKFESCIYSDRLLDKLMLLNESAQNQINITEIRKAIYCARKYHGNQRRLSGELYYSHPLEVAYNVSDYLFKTDMIITSILHDTLEDTALTFEMITDLFGETVAQQVEDLTRIKKDHKISSKENIETLWLENKYELLLIKQFDRLHNIETISSKSPHKIKKTLNETIESFIVLAAYLGIRELEDKLINLCVTLVTKHYPDDSNDLLYKSDDQLLSLVLQNDEERK